MTTEIAITKFSQSAQAPSTFASQPSFTQKLLNFSITLAQNAQGAQPTSFAEAQGSASPGTISVSGARARVRIANAGAPSSSQADMLIYGLSESLMNQLTTLGVIFNRVEKNQIIVSAGAASNADASAANASQAFSQNFPVVFGGTIWLGFGDYSQMPEVPFKIVAQGGLIAAVQSAKPTSYNGSTSVADIIQNIAGQMGVAFENNGVSATLQNPYYPGTLLQQAYQVGEHANVGVGLVDGGTKLAIWPSGGSRTSQSSVPLISKTTGMITAPTFAQNGYMFVKAVYNPDVLFRGNIQVQSDNVPQANKTWTVYKMDLVLDTLDAGGDWMMILSCFPTGLSAPPPPPVTS